MDLSGLERTFLVKKALDVLSKSRAIAEKRCLENSYGALGAARRSCVN
jgi:hypothetical protein